MFFFVYCDMYTVIVYLYNCQGSKTSKFFICTILGLLSLPLIYIFLSPWFKIETFNYAPLPISTRVLNITVKTHVVKIA